MGRTEDDHVKQNKPCSERQRLNVFSCMWNIDPKEKCIPKYKHDHIYAYIYMYIYRERE
jgi:hypothetical protein